VGGRIAGRPDAAGTWPLHIRFLLCAAALWGCQARGTDALDYPATTPHEKYERAFRRVGLETTALGYKWIMASRAALDGALPIEAPYREVGYFDPHDAQSLGFRMSLRRGQELLVEVDPEGGGQLFIDLFRVRDDSLSPPQHVAAADSGSVHLDYFVRRSGEYVLRLQPELLAGGSYVITFVNAASLAFPVAGRGMGAIRSVFGDPRDGGRRDHHGVDIFAPRGTPVLAAAPGTIRSTRPTRLGGKVVWLRTEPQGNLYYAHLDSVHVRRGMQVEVGDTLGFVGNTGNARTTPTHLHFGVYAGGPNDPIPYLFDPPSTPPALLADVGYVGTDVRTTGEREPVLHAAERRAAVVDEVPLHTAMKVLGGAGAYYRVLLPNGETGFVRASSVQPFDAPLATDVLARRGALLDRPERGAGLMDSLPAGERLPVMGRFGGYVLVQASSGQRGWVEENTDLWQADAGVAVAPVVAPDAPAPAPTSSAEGEAGSGSGGRQSE
jgi:peptidoglycan LD-endopeptidase LytH